MNKEEYTYLTEKYLDGSLTGPEKDQYENELKNNSVLAEDLHLQKTIRDLLSDKDEMELREKLYTIKKEIKNKRKLVYIFSSAASVIVIFVSGYFIFLDRYSNSELFDKYYNHIIVNEAYRGTNIATETDISSALNEYEKGNYTEAIKGFCAVNDTSSDHITAMFLTALSYMETGNDMQALKYFDMPEVTGSMVFGEDAAWYGALCLLRSDKTAEAKTRLQKLIDENSVYSEKAAGIINEID